MSGDLCGAKPLVSTTEAPSGSGSESFSTYRLSGDEFKSLLPADDEDCRRATSPLTFSSSWPTLLPLAVALGAPVVYAQEVTGNRFYLGCRICGHHHKHVAARELVSLANLAHFPLEIMPGLHFAFARTQFVQARMALLEAGEDKPLPASSSEV